MITKFSFIFIDRLKYIRYVTFIICKIIENKALLVAVKSIPEIHNYLCKQKIDFLKLIFRFKNVNYYLLAKLQYNYYHL